MMVYGSWIYLFIFGSVTGIFYRSAGTNSFITESQQGGAVLLRVDTFVLGKTEVQGEKNTNNWGSLHDFYIYIYFHDTMKELFVIFLSDVLCLQDWGSSKLTIIWSHRSLVPLLLVNWLVQLSTRACRVSTCFTAPFDVKKTMPWKLMISRDIQEISMKNHGWKHFTNLTNRSWCSRFTQSTKEI